MAVLAVKDVQQWLEATRLTLDELPSDLEETARAIAFSIVGGTYDTATWVDAGTTPAAIKAGISLLVAGWYYQKSYSGVDGANDYGLHLEAKGMAWLEGIASGENDLVEIPGTTSDSMVAFWPNDSTGLLEVLDGQGQVVGVAGSDDIQFRMSGRY